MVHWSVPPSGAAGQSESTLHWTHLPAMALMVVSPQTVLGGLLSPVQGVPVAAGVKVGMSGPGGEPVLVQAGFVWQTVLAVGRSVASSIDVTPPLPSQTSFWQSPGV